MNKTYLGSCKEKSGNYGSFLALSFSKEDLKLMANKLNERGYVNLNVSKRKELGKFGDTHAVSIYEFSGEKAPHKKPSNSHVAIEDIPF